MNNEFILCAAIWINDSKLHIDQPINIDIGFVICGRRHNNCYQTISDLVGDCNKYLETLNMSDDDYRKHQGFMTSLNRYVDRREAFIIAKNNKQIIHGLSFFDDSDDNSILISENLY